jgi:hypothetical protein
MKITRRGVLEQLALLVAVSDAVPSVVRANAPDATPSIATSPAELLHGALVWDDHSGFDPVPDYDLEHLEDWRRAGVSYLSIDVGYDVIGWELAVRNLGAYITWLEKRADKFLLVRRADDVLEAKKTGRMATPRPPLAVRPFLQPSRHGLGRSVASQAPASASVAR